MLVVGEREANEGTVSIRLRDGRQLGNQGSSAMKVSDFVDYVVKKVESRDLEL
jgi:threonyl-tRNA synthetase